MFFLKILLFHHLNDFTEVFDIATKEVDVLLGPSGSPLPRLLAYDEDFCLLAISDEEFLQIETAKTRLVNIRSGYESTKHEHIRRKECTV